LQKQNWLASGKNNSGVMLSGQTHHLFRGITMPGQGTKPAGKPLPSRVRQFEGENLQDAQGNGMEIDKTPKGFNLEGYFCRKAI
jgi:hypothetical protein